MSSSYRSNRLGLSHRDPYAVRRGGCLELYYCNMVEWFWWDSSLISTTNWFLSVPDTIGLVIWPVKIVPEMTYYVSSGWDVTRLYSLDGAVEPWLKRPACDKQRSASCKLRKVLKCAQQLYRRRASVKAIDVYLISIFCKPPDIAASGRAQMLKQLKSMSDER